MSQTNTHENESWWTRAAQSALQVPTDVAAVVAYVLLVGVAVGLDTLAVPVRTAVALPLVLFLPGYALLSVLFPSDRTAESATPGDPVLLIRGSALAWGHRVLLSFAVSVALLPPLGIGLAATRLGYEPMTVVDSLAILTVVGMVSGGVRRLRHHSGDGYRVPYRRWLDETTGAVFGRASRLDTGLDLALAAAVVVAVATLGYAFVAPPSAASYSEFYLVSETGQGTPTASDYPTAFTAGQSRPIVVGIDNGEGHQVSYAVVAQLQRVRTQGGAVQVVERRQLDRFRTTLDAGERTRVRRTLTPETAGEDLRLVFLLYTDDVPETPTMASADRSLFLWVDVSLPDRASSSGSFSGARDRYSLLEGGLSTSLSPSCLVAALSAPDRWRAPRPGSTGTDGRGRLCSLPWKWTHSM